jgi:asparagine synthase (glutamine-hydrolysing)
MNAAMVHRGPDDEGVHIDSVHGVALGARRLSIIDVSGGHQPLSNEDGTVWAVLNGEIYNFGALRERLRQSGHSFKTRGDTEVLVHLYEQFGPDLVDHLDGMYALAIWDSRQGVLLLARDRFGEKPLFYAQRGEELTFASELTALRAGMDVREEVDPKAVDDFFVWGYIPGNASIVQPARQLPAAHRLIWRQGTRTVEEEYWRPEPQGEQHRPLAELVGQARHLLEESVASRLVADRPVGLFLSGGTDSALLAAIAARKMHGELRTFTVGYASGGVNETREARRIAALVGARHREVCLDDREVAVRVPRILGRLDQPQGDQALVALHAVAELASAEVTVGIGGEGADEIFGGYPRYRWLALADRMGQTIPSPLLTGVGHAAALLRRPRRLARVQDLLEPAALLGRHMRWVTDRRSDRRAVLYGPRLEPFRHRNPVEGLLTELAAPIAGEGVEGRLMRLDQRHWLPDDVLQKADRASMSASLEMRSPYLSRELTQFAATVPPDLQIRNGGKTLLRSVLADLLPEAPARIPKRAFRVPAAEWLRGSLAPTFEQQLQEGSLYRDGWFNRVAVQAMFKAHRRRERDESGTLWVLLALGLWMDAGQPGL